MLAPMGDGKPITFQPMTLVDAEAVKALLLPRLGRRSEIAPLEDRIVKDLCRDDGHLPPVVSDLTLLSKSPTEVLFFSAERLLPELWPFLILVLLGIAPPLVMYLQSLPSSSGAPSSASASAATAFSFPAFMLAMASIQTGVVLALMFFNGILGKRVVVLTPDALSTATSLLGDSYIISRKTYTFADIVARGRVYCKDPNEDRSAVWRFFFPESAIELSSLSFFELNKYPLYMPPQAAKAVYDYVLMRANSVAIEDVVL